MYKTELKTVQRTRKTVLKDPMYANNIKLSAVIAFSLYAIF